MAEPLDPLTLPLRGARLIEASAGTGKTWTLAALVLRLVLGHGQGEGDDGTAPPRPLQPAQILVMTFTRAATRELSDRIRRRLAQAAAAFRSEEPLDHDPFLDALRRAYPEGPAREQAAWRLASAAEAMDEAAVHTIDAWCQRMLREHAFDSGCLFDEELLAQEAQLRAEAARDYWRVHVYPLEAASVARVQRVWRDVEALRRDVADLLPPDPEDDALAGVDLAALVQAWADELAALKAGWVERVAEMRAWLEAVWADKKHPAKGAVPRKQDAPGWLDQLLAWAQDPAADDPDLGKTAPTRLRGSDLRQKLAQTEGAEAVRFPPAFDAFDDLQAALAGLVRHESAMRRHAAAWIHARMAQQKARAGRFGFADMIDRLDAALDEATQGEAARRLRARILAQYPAALVDEFQDTSPVQLRIFDRLYRLADDDRSRTLLLIGDPKQAIYGFRGADIGSYLHARRLTAGRHHVLGTNHRSTEGVVAAVNHLFGRAEARPGGGAFLYRQGSPETVIAPGAAVASTASELPFLPVRARGRDEVLQAAGGPVPALTLVTDPEPRNADDTRALLAAHAAERIVALLNDPQAGFATPGAPLQRLRPADIAVLVRDTREAAAVRRALRGRGLPSVYLSERDSVLATDEAVDLLRLLRAVAQPRDVKRARAALATAMLGFSLPELRALADDDLAFDHRMEQLQALHATWQAQGVLAMLRRALHLFDVPARLLGPGGDAGATRDGERRLTNVLHLAELLQAASAQAEGEQGLIRWLAGQIDEARAGLGGGDELMLRLESDAERVQVVTVHKSKGLEYPLVFLPFGSALRPVEPQHTVVSLPRPGGGRTRVLQPTPAQREQADDERLREDLRLLYVALTRARHALWVGVGSALHRKVDHWHRSALGCLISGLQPRDAAQRRADIGDAARGCADIVHQVLDVGEALRLPPRTPLATRAALAPLAAAPAYRGEFDRRWAIASYSALVRDAARATPPSGLVSPRLLRDDDERPPAPAAPEEARAAPQRLAADAPWHRFPRGAYAGNFLHDQLEWLAGEGFALATQPGLGQALQRRCERQGWGHRADDVQAWLLRVCDTAMPPVGAPLSGLQRVIPELEFWLPGDGLRASVLDQGCREQLWPALDRPALPERALHGLLMGFADLVFEHGGRYWVLDYKSNALGTADADYTGEALARAMCEHRYDVQAVLYLLALHRLLKARLGAAYEPARQLGGAVYLFLRGIEGPQAGCCHVAPPLALLQALDAGLDAARTGAGEGT